MADAAYEIELVDLDAQAALRLAGEFDLANAPQLRDRLAILLARRRRVLVDMGDVTYIDSSAIGVFMEAQKSATAQGLTFRLVNVSGSQARVLEVTGLYDLLTDEEARERRMTEQRAAAII